MSSAKPTRKQADLAEVLELVLDKGIVINADIAVTVGDTELLGVEIRAAIASFETAAEYGLAFPSGTDMRRVEQASGRDPIDEEDAVDLGIDASRADDDTGADPDDATDQPPQKRPDPSAPFGGSEDEREETEPESNRDDEGEAPTPEQEAEDG